MQKIAIGGILQHYPKGIGFKITCRDKKTAILLKNKVCTLIKELGYKISEVERYYD
jgi:hypothetical protein